MELYAVSLKSCRYLWGKGLLYVNFYHLEHAYIVLFALLLKNCFVPFVVSAIVCAASGLLRILQHILHSLVNLQV